MTDGKKIGVFLGVLIGVCSLYYTGVYFNAKNSNVVISTDSTYINDVSNISAGKVDAVNKYLSYYELDSSSNFNPQDSLNRIDSIVIVDKLAKQLVPSYSTSKPSVVPYFEDYSNGEQNSDAILRVVNLIDNKEGYYKHYNILGYKLNRQQAITKREFLNLIAVFLPVNKDLGDDYIIKNLINYGFTLGSDLDTELSREDSAVYIQTLMNALNK